MENTKILVSQRRIFMAKAAWNIGSPTTIGEIEEVIKQILYSGNFQNGVEYIKELEGTKFVRVSKEQIKRLMSYDATSEELVTKLFKIY